MIIIIYTELNNRLILTVSIDLTKLIKPTSSADSTVTPKPDPLCRVLSRINQGSERSSGQLALCPRRGVVRALWKDR